MEKAVITSTPPKISVHDEYQYLNLIRDILQNGEQRPDRHDAPASHHF